MALRRRIKCAIGWAAFAVVAITIGVVFSWFILDQIEAGVNDQVKIRTPQDDLKAFNQWDNTSTDDVPAKYWKITFFNVTNSLDVIHHGAPPNVTECGPYVYREYQVNYNYAFLESSTQIVYNEQYFYVPEPSMTVGSADDIIVNAYTTYITAVKQAGDENSLVLGATGPMLNTALEILAGVFCAFGASTEETMTSEQHAMLIDHFDGMRRRIRSISKAPSTRASRRAAATDDVSTPLPPVCPAGMVQSGIQWGDLSGVPTKKPGQWLVNPGTSYSNSSNPVVKLLGGLPDIAQLLTALYQAAAYPEYAAYAKFVVGLPSAAFLTPATATALLFGSEQFPCPFLNSTMTPQGLIPCPALFASLYLNSSASAKAVFPLSDLQLSTMFGYILTTANAVLNILTSQAGATEFSTGGRTWIGRKPTEWLYLNNDPLLQFLGQPITNSAYFPQNYTDQQAAFQANPLQSQMYTGYGAVGLSQAYTRWGNVSVLPQRAGGMITSPGYWCHTAEPVNGFYDGQFSPGTHDIISWLPAVTEQYTPQVWVNEVFRSVQFEYYSSLSVKGIDVLRFRLSPSNFFPNPKYDQPTFGLVNLTCPEAGTPIYVTLPRWMNATLPSTWGNISNLKPPIPQDDFQTFLDVDPVTGITLRGIQRLQLNLLIPKGVGGVVADTLLPIMVVEEIEVMTDKDASDYKDKIIFAFNLRHNLFYGLVVGGCCLFALCIIVIIFTKERHEPAPSLQYAQVWQQNLLNNAGDTSA